MYLELERRPSYRAYNPANSDLEQYLDFSDLLQKEYHSPAVWGFMERETETYSKVTAVNRFYENLKNDEESLSFDEAEAIFAALFTDQGLLFPQTRERDYRSEVKHACYSRHRSSIMGELWGKQGNSTKDKKVKQMLASSQEQEFRRQAEAANNFSLRDFQPIAEVLDVFLHPLDGGEDKRFHKKPVEKGNDLEEMEKKLNDTFLSYYNSARGNAMASKKGKQGVTSLTQSFVISYTEKGSPYYLDRPDVIFHTVRAKTTSAIKAPTGAKAIQTDIQQSLQMPLSVSTLSLDRKLYYGIVDACAQGCRTLRCPFPEKAWRELWPVLEQAVQATAFELCDLLTYGHFFTKILRDRDLWEPFDRWIYDKMLGEREPFFHALYYTMYLQSKKKAKSGRGKARRIKVEQRKREKEEACFERLRKPYEALFLVLKGNQDWGSKYVTMYKLQSSFNWSQVKVMPTVESLLPYIPDHVEGRADRAAWFCKLIKESDTPYEVVKSTPGKVVSLRKLKKNPEEWTDIRCLFAEWMSVQILSHRASWQLLECACSLLKRMQNGMA